MKISKAIEILGAAYLKYGDVTLVGLVTRRSIENIKLYTYKGKIIACPLFANTDFDDMEELTELHHENE